MLTASLLNHRLTLKKKTHTQCGKKRIPFQNELKSCKMKLKVIQTENGLARVNRPRGHLSLQQQPDRSVQVPAIPPIYLSLACAYIWRPHPVF